MKKMPWGIITGICAMFVFFLTAGVVGVYILLDGIAAQTNTEAAFFGEWYQILMFVFDIVFVLGLVGSLTMYILKEKNRTEEVSV
ncbi:MAG: hypothetical protein OSJ83_02825 [Clostridia bacterium]|nr:hypothetical protein [Clostridia bacterium]